MWDTGCGVALVDPDRRVIECNAEFAALASTETSAGFEFDHGLSESAATPHRRAHAYVFSRNQPMAVDGFFGPRLSRTTYRVAEVDGVPCVLVVVAPWSPDWSPPEGVTLIDAEAGEGTALGVLTPREREVLAGIGRGLTTAEIAKELHRSTKTIEGHRVSLGIKLGVANRVQLARIAIRAGISPLDDRVLEPKPGPGRYNGQVGRRGSA